MTAETRNPLQDLAPHQATETVAGPIQIDTGPRPSTSDRPLRPLCTWARLEASSQTTPKLDWVLLLENTSEHHQAAQIWLEGLNAAGEVELTVLDLLPDIAPTSCDTYWETTELGEEDLAARLEAIRVRVEPVDPTELWPRQLHAH